MTYGSADTQDLFIEQFRETPDGRDYLFKGKWRESEVLKETIEVRGGDAVEHQVTITHHGPVIAGDPAAGVGVAISDPGLVDGSRWVDAALDAMKSRSVPELHEAFRHWTDRVNNYAVADVDGNFGYIHAGKIPVRGEANGWRAVPGWTGEYEWDGYIPHDELPKAINPETGYAVTCNQRVAGHDYPYYVGLCFAAEHRARRVQAGILGLEAGSAAVHDMARIHADSISEPARVFTRALMDIEPLDADSEAALALMREWDYSMDRDLAQPLIYAKTKAHLVQRIVEHLLGDFASEVLSEAAGSGTVLRQIVEQMTLGIERGDTSITPHGGEWEGLLAAGLGDAVRELRDSFGEDMSEWRWGRLHRTEPRHPLSEVFRRRRSTWIRPRWRRTATGIRRLRAVTGCRRSLFPRGYR